MGPVLWNDGIFWGNHRLTQGSARTTGAADGQAQSSQGGDTYQSSPLPEPDIDRADYLRVMGSDVHLDPLPVPDIDRADYLRVMGRGY